MLPGVTATIGQLLDHGVTVRWKCQQCETAGVADLARIVAAKGREYCLTDKTAPCRAPGCTYWANFYGQAGMRNWKLQTDAGMMRQMQRRSDWLSEKWRREGLL